MKKHIFTYKDIQKYNPLQLLDAMGFEYDGIMKFVTPCEIRSCCNGMGAKDSPFNALIPNTIWGLDISLCSVPHDWGYAYGADREEVDKQFYKNALKLIELKGGWKVVKWLRKRRAWDYYEILRLAGGPAWKAGHERKYKPEPGDIPA